MKPLDGSIIIGGSNVSAVRLSKGLANLKVRVTVCCGTAPEDAHSLPLLLPWAEVHPLPIMQVEGSWRYGLSFYRRFVSYLLSRRTTCDIISFHSGFSEYALFLGALRRLLGQPVVYTAYCVLSAFGQAGGIVSPFVRCSLNSINRIVAISQNVAQSMITSGVQKSRILTIPPPVDNISFIAASDKDKIRQDLHVGHDEIVYLFIGNYKKSKGLDILIQSFGEVIQNIPHAKLIYTTEHESESSKDDVRRIESLVRELPYRDRVLHLKGVSDMQRLMASADVLVMPFLDTDGPSDYPIAIIEAMAVGKPVIATGVGGIPEIVCHGETGILADRGSVENLSQAMVELGNDESKRRQFGLNAVEKSKRFRLDRIARETLDVYENVIRQG